MGPKISQSDYIHCCCLVKVRICAVQKLFKPALPNDAVISFYIQAQKLVLAVYHLCTNQLNKVDIAARYQVRSAVRWFSG